MANSLNIFFDVDYTMQGVDGSLRPGTREIFQRLAGDGHRIFVWSGVGDRTADVQRHELEDLVTAVFEKPVRDFKDGLEEKGVSVWPDFVIDDYPEIVGVFGGVLIRPYFFTSADDTEMERVYRIIGDYVGNGFSDDAAYRARNGGQPIGSQ